MGKYKILVLIFFIATPNVRYAKAMDLEAIRTDRLLNLIYNLELAEKRILINLLMNSSSVNKDKISKTIFSEEQRKLKTYKEMLTSPKALSIREINKILRILVLENQKNRHEIVEKLKMVTDINPVNYEKDKPLNYTIEENSKGTYKRRKGISDFDFFIRRKQKIMRCAKKLNTEKQQTKVSQTNNPNTEKQENFELSDFKFNSQEFPADLHFNLEKSTDPKIEHADNEANFEEKIIEQFGEEDSKELREAYATQRENTAKLDNALKILRQENAAIREYNQTLKTESSATLINTDQQNKESFEKNTFTGCRNIPSHKDVLNRLEKSNPDIQKIKSKMDPQKKQKASKNNNHDKKFEIRNKLLNKKFAIFGLLSCVISGIIIYKYFYKNQKETPSNKAI